MSTTVVQPTSTDKTIKGTGEAGNVVTVTIGDSITKTATVGSDGNYEIDFGKAIGNANQSVVVKQSESPDAQVYTGGQGIATTTIKAPPLTISPTTANITYNAADLKALAGKTQQEVVDWLVNKAQITAKNTDDASDQLTFMSDTSDVLKALQAGENTGSATIKVYAKNVTNDETSRATVTATYDGELAFSVVAPTITFGTNELPTTTAKEFAVTNQPVLKIKDTRATGSKWALMARTDGLKDGTTSLNGQLLYRDAQGNQVPLTASNTKLTGGQKVAGQTETPVDLDSSATGDKAGIFLQVQAGNKIGAYSGTINWTLTDAP
ncbi:WxL domain-containing protein [Lactiplantibacillus modestisalitolerans]|uniref:WxL domain-containing protein n=1 Tax=Lactiplantibacillus modestisalitolerans TaxID=1457219 RepID=A0ABV5WR84_9LACO